MVQYFIIKHKNGYGIRFDVSNEIFVPDGSYYVGSSGRSYEIYPNYNIQTLDEVQRILHIFKNDIKLKRELLFEIIEQGSC